MVKEAIKSGARKKVVCDLLGISIRSIERWESKDTLTDKRTLRHIEPANKLIIAEQKSVLQVANSARFCDLPSCQF